MNDKIPSQQAKNEPSLVGQVGMKVARKLKSRRNASAGVWFGLGMMGLIGWSVVVPTLLGAALGVWIDTSKHGTISWTLTLLLFGLIIGCLNAWHWVSRQDTLMREEQEENDE